MNTADFTTSILVSKTTKETFDAVNNVRGWWSEEIEGRTDKAGAVFLYHYEDVHRCEIEITALVPGQKVEWRVLDNYFKFTKDKTEWVGTKIIFDISEKNGQTELRFMHQGLVPEYECYDICYKAWTHYVQQSLFNLIMTGKGQPNGKDKPSAEHEKNFQSAS